jgi:hypothetical protein
LRAKLIHKTNPSDLGDSWHYTTDHPKALAVCTFGGRRIGGLVFSDRSKLLARKMVMVLQIFFSFKKARAEECTWDLLILVLFLNTLALSYGGYPPIHTIIT